MRENRRIVVQCGLVAVMIMWCVQLGSTQTSAPGASVDAPVQHPPAMFSGVWDYNDADSINVATGRPEQSPRGATQRTASGRVAAAPRGGGDAGTGRIAMTRDSGLGPTPAMLREARDMSRDLLEVPEALTIEVGNESVTFTDDLERERTYPTDARKQRYQLGASEFNARMQWIGSRLVKEIEGDFGFRMSETYFLSNDARRLFVIVRVGETSRNRPPAGFDRVYDRVE